jgi:hypothetical protein
MSDVRQVNLEIRVPENISIVIGSPHTDDRVVADASASDPFEIFLPESDAVPVSGGLRLQLNVIP